MEISRMTLQSLKHELRHAKVCIEDGIDLLDALIANAYKLDVPDTCCTAIDPQDYVDPEHCADYKEGPCEENPCWDCMYAHIEELMPDE